MLYNLMEQIYRLHMLHFPHDSFFFIYSSLSKQKKQKHFKRKLQCRIIYEMSSICNWIAKCFNFNSVCVQGPIFQVPSHVSQFFLVSQAVGTWCVIMVVSDGSAGHGPQVQLTGCVV